jgi:hypothetical protein
MRDVQTSSYRLNRKDYIPDYIYRLCRGAPYHCNVCSNVVYSNVLDNYVHDTERAKVFCPFGKGESLNLNTFGDQTNLYSIDTLQNPNYFKTKWGHAPQLTPRPLAKIGLEWRTA